MRIYLLMAAVVCAHTAIAQKNLKNEIGIMGDATLSGGDNEQVASVGVQYKHWRNKHFAWRFGAGYSLYTDRTSTRYLSTRSTEYIKIAKTNYKLPMAQARGGFEVQWNLYRKLFFYCGAELAAGYGDGYYRTEYQPRVLAPATHLPASAHNYTVNSSSASGFWAGVGPFMGLKINWKRIVLGTEFSNPMHFTDKAVTPGRLFDVDLVPGQINQRVFVNYVF